MKRLAGISALLLLASLAPAGQDENQKKDPFAELIGKPAIDFQADFAVNGKPVTLAQLKNKVVLLDFWAVWCGPCIRTFPHLRDWHAQYRDQGLEIVGLTGYYEKVGFDKEAGKVKILQEKMTAAQEQDMLKEFAQHHKLEHRLQALSSADQKELYAKYGIRGIPTAVLIDRKGNIRLVKVGSGEENAKAIEENIKKLLAE